MRWIDANKVWTPRARSSGVMSRWFEVYGCAEVHPGLVVGAYPLDDEDVSQLAALGIERVLNLVEDLEYEEGRREAVEAALSDAGIVERRLSLVDFGGLAEPEIEQAVAQVVEWLDDQRHVYLHCRAGWQRSATVAAGVIAEREGVDPDGALGRLGERKPTAAPLEHQREDLRSWWRGRSAT